MQANAGGKNPQIPSGAENNFLKNCFLGQVNKAENN